MEAIVTTSQEKEDRDQTRDMLNGKMALEDSPTCEKQRKSCRNITKTQKKCGSPSG